MPFVDLAAGRVFLDAGPAAALSESAKVVMLHGAYDSRRLWRGVMGRLDDVGCVAVDLPGHGWSEGAALTTSAEYVDFIDALLSRLGLVRPILCGHSMGGSMALAYTLARRRPVIGLCLISSAPDWAIADSDIALWSTDPERAFVENDAMMFAPATPPAVRKAYGDELRTCRPSTCAADLMACASFSLRDGLPDADVPSAVIWGDSEYWADGSRALAAALPDAEATVVADAGHAIIAEQPAAVADGLRQFLRRIRESEV